MTAKKVIASGGRLPQLPRKLDDGGEIGGGRTNTSAGESVCFGVKEEYAHCVGMMRCLSMESFFVTPLYRMQGSSFHESSLYQGDYPGSVSGRDAPPGPIQPVALGLTAQQGGRRKANRKDTRKNRKSSRKANRKDTRKNRKASRKASRKNRKASRKAGRKNRKNNRKASRKANRKNSRKNSRKNNRRNNM